MPNQLDSSGLQVATVTEIVSALIAGFQSIYGSDINTDQNSPDGQALNIFAQAIADQLELLSQVYTSFDPDSAFGVMCDQRFALNGISRQAGSYTLQPVDVTFDRAVTINGIDALEANPSAQVFTVQDDSGNQFQLQTTYAATGAGTQSLIFQAVSLGKVQTTVNTITVISTVTLGVTGVNNSSGPVVVGQDEETDTQFKIRRAKSFSLAATGPADAVLAALLETAGVTDAYVAENTTGGVVTEIPAHAIWCIVQGGRDSDVANVIRVKKAPGCGMQGGTSVVLSRPAGNTFTAKFDRPVNETLHVKLTLVPKKAGVTFDIDVVKAALVSALTYGIAQAATTGDIVLAMLTINPDAICTTLGVSPDGSTWTDVLATTDFQHRFVLSAGNITVTV